MNTKRNIYCVIMAGGVGSRFWPKSRKSMPKQFLDIFGNGKSFIRMTYERFLSICTPDHFLVVTNAMYRDLVLDHIPELDPTQILCEPIGRNTAPCIAYAAYYLKKKDPDAVMVVTPSDHVILKEEAFSRILSDSIDFVDSNNALMTIGVTPSRPETGYGYIQVTDSQRITKVKCFTEKPNLELAQTFIQCGEFFWNSGIFIWKIEDITQAFSKYLPEHHAMFSEITPAYSTEKEHSAIELVFSECKSISIDYGIMEKAENVYVCCGDFGWSDVGTWGSLYMHSKKDKYANATLGDGCYLYDTRSSIIHLPKGKIAIINGLKDYIVVDTEDALLICPKCEEQNIKKYLEDVKFKEGEKHI